MILEFFTNQFASLGAWFFFIGAMVEALPLIGTFLPGATIVTLGGFASAQGYFVLWKVIAFSISGAIVGDAISYYVGAHGGDYIRRKNIISPSILLKGEAFFLKYGNQSLLWGRFIGPIRAIIPFLAGLAKLRPKTFWTWNIIGGIMWGFFYVLLGHFSGNLVAVILKRWSHKLNWFLLLLTLFPILYWLIKHHGQSFKQYIKDQSAIFTKNIESYQFIQKMEKRYPAISEFFISKSAQLKLYFSVISFILLSVLAVLTLIFDWI